MAAKQRNIFAIKNFRGLDKENKLLKVEPYRATDGFNFKIDSNVLKTRPSLDFIKEPPFTFTTNDYLIDFYEYGQVDIYVTRYAFYFVPKNDANRGTPFDHTTNFTAFVKSGIAATFDFVDRRPLFQEEKDCLFIFGLNNIYVFSYIEAVNNFPRYYFFYELRSKPGMPPVYINNTELQTKFNDLPNPYIPTVILDNKPFDDVNLLSKKSYYKYFAAEPTSSTTETTYYIPTYYNKDKHGEFNVNDNNQCKVEFYKNRYENFTTYPVFLGALNQTFFVTSPATVTSLFGTEITGSTVGSGKNDNFEAIQDTYFSKLRFLYHGKPHQSPTPIETIIGLTKNEFFEMIVKNSNGKTVFEFLMEYIKANQSTLTANRHVVFSLNVQYKAEYKDIQTDFITDVSIHEAIFNIYVQLKSDEIIGVNFTNSNTFSNSTFTTTLGDNYPAFPTITQTPDLTLSLGNTPILLTNNEASFNSEFKSLAETKIKQEEAQYASGDKVRVNGYLYKIRTIQQQKETVIPSIAGTNFVNNSGSFVSTTLTNLAAPPVLNDYLSLNFPAAVQGVPQIDLGLLNGNGFVYPNTSTFTFADNSDERNALRQDILNEIGTNAALTNNAVNGAGTAWFRVRMYKSFFSGQFAQNGAPVFFYRVATVLVLVSYKLETLVEQQERHSMSYVADVYEATRPIEEVLFTKKFNEENNTVELTVKNYFYDYKNEPTILVTIDFPLNTEYNYIAESKFGVNFGSENRLFLAGNPNFPNIDRYNVSNDLLGSNIKSQSYELTYFPSKSYRVVGGKGAINGYVVATDTQLYVTKEEYPNDNKLFVRQRNIDNGAVFYSDIKTNIDKTPLNNRCIVRFYNDILILDKNGLYGIELSQNVLTDERLVKLRSGFINEELKQKIAAYDKSKIFITENNIELQIYIDKDVYVADSKYIAQNPNSAAENVSYEIVKWIVPIRFVHGYVKNSVVYLFPENAKFVYTYGLENFDQIHERILDGSFSLIQLGNTTPISTFALNNSNLSKSTPQSTFDASVFRVETPLYRVVATIGNDYTFNTTGNIFTLVNNTTAFAHLTDGNTLHWDGNGTAGFQTSPFTITDFESSSRTTFTYPENASRATSGKVYEEVTEKRLYITHYFWISTQSSNFTPNADTSLRLVLSPFKPTSAIKFTRVVGENDSTYVQRIQSAIGLTGISRTEYFTISNASITKARISEETQINLRWVSAITDFGISTMEKTSFRANIFATKQPDTNNMTFGYRTLRRLAGLSDVIDLSNNFNLNNIEYSQFSLATFNTVAMSLPMKENNFLYIQFIINGYGKIELNGIEILYKANRMIRSVG